MRVIQNNFDKKFSDDWEVILSDNSEEILRKVILKEATRMLEVMFTEDCSPVFIDFNNDSENPLDLDITICPNGGEFDSDEGITIRLDLHSPMDMMLYKSEDSVEGGEHESPYIKKALKVRDAILPFINRINALEKTINEKSEGKNYDRA